MLIIHSKEGKMSAVVTGSTTEICAEVAMVIHEIAHQITHPYEETAKKLIAIKVLRAALSYAIEEAIKDVSNNDGKTV